MRESREEKLQRFAQELVEAGYTVTPPAVGPRCQKCRSRIVLGTGDLIGGKWCGRCAAIEMESHGEEKAA